MEKERDSEILVQLGSVLEVTDNYITSFVMRSDEDRIAMLLNNSWKAPASIKYMIDHADDEKEFYRLALEDVISQGAKSAYLYLLPEPVICDRREDFKCPDMLSLVAEYRDDKIEVYEDNERPVITKEGGFVDTLRTDEGKDGLVLMMVVHPCGHHGDEPLLQGPVQIGLYVVVCLLWMNGAHMDALLYLADTILTVPLGQFLHILPDGVDMLGDAAIHHALHIGWQHTLASLVGNEDA